MISWLMDKHAIVSINITQVKPVNWNKKSFDRLVLDDGTKSLLRALIGPRISSSKKMDDIIHGKGNGLIMLLHGSPGTGKSLTAERYELHATAMP
jgi:transcriptional regulator with AAA-type ATPase domain